MTDSATHNDSSPTLPEFLARRARASSDRRLVIDAAAGIVAAAATLIFRPAVWLLIVSAALCFAAFGTWGILDRELADAPAAGRRTTILRTARGLAAFAGAVAALGALLAVFGYALGTWIS